MWLKPYLTPKRYHFEMDRGNVLIISLRATLKDSLTAKKYNVHVHVVALSSEHTACKCDEIHH